PRGLPWPCESNAWVLSIRSRVSFRLRDYSGLTRSDCDRRVCASHLRDVLSVQMQSTEVDSARHKPLHRMQDQKDGKGICGKSDIDKEVVQDKSRKRRTAAIRDVCG